MYTSSVNLLLADTGSTGVELVRALLKRAKSRGLISQFVGARPDLANRWVRARPRDILSERIELKEADLDAVFGAGEVKALADDLHINSQEVVRLLNETLFAGARLSAPDGERASERAAQRLDADIRSQLL